MAGDQTSDTPSPDPYNISSHIILADLGWSAVSYSSLSITQVKIYSTLYLHFVIILFHKIHDYSKFLLSCQIKVKIKQEKSLFIRYEQFSIE